MNQIAFSNRVQRIKPSPTTASAQLARQLKAEGRDIISLTTGEPDFDTPPHIVEAAFAAVRRGETRYTNVGGTEALKSAIVEKFRTENGLSFETREVMAATGAKQIIFNALLATVNDGDEVIIPTPSWVSYPDMTLVAGGKPVLAETGLEASFKLSPSQLEQLITTRTRWLILNSPSNPTGRIYSASELEALGQVLLKHPQIMVLSDDIYEHLIYEEGDVAVMAAVCPELRRRVLTVNGVSKAYAMTGWRLGFCGGPAALIKQMSKLQSQSTSSPSAIGQAGAVAALTGPKDFLVEQVASLKRRRDIVVDRLNAIEGLTCQRPEGAFYVFPSCQALMGKTTPGGQILESDEDFVRYLLDSVGVATVSGTAFGTPLHLRISFATNEAALRDACDRIERACAQLKG